MPFWLGKEESVQILTPNLLVSNSTWIAEDRPCITYGLRGVVHCALEVSILL